MTCCISKILEIKGDDNILTVEPHARDDTDRAVEDGGIYNGYEYLIVFSVIGYRLAYISIPDEHMIYGISTHNELPVDLHPHGGVTFYQKRHMFLDEIPECNCKWLGFDAAHCEDGHDMEKSEEYFGERHPFLSFINANEASSKYYRSSFHKAKSLGYMKMECEMLIDQLISMRESDLIPESN